MQSLRPNEGAKVRPIIPDATLRAPATELTAYPAEGKAGRGLSAAQIEMVGFCAEAARQLGFSQSVGQIFGVIFAVPHPVVFADVVALLGVSNGSASQGLRFLRELGAIKLVAVEGDRREHFVAETELRQLLTHLLAVWLGPALEAGERRLQTLRPMVETAAEAEGAFLRDRLARLETWQRNAVQFLPLIEGALALPKA